jgi:isoleucyl-tRNA synthetase
VARPLHASRSLDRLDHEVVVEPLDSVHLADWKVTPTAWRDEALEQSMDVARRLSALGRAARADAGVKVRQPLARALVFLPSGTPMPPAGIVEDELNVDELEIGGELAQVLAFEVVPDFRAVGPILGEAVKELRPALAQLDGAAMAATLEAGNSVVVELSTGRYG